MWEIDFGNQSCLWFPLLEGETPMGPGTHWRPEFVQNWEGLLKPNTVHRQLGNGLGGTFVACKEKSFGMDL